MGKYSIEMEDIYSELDGLRTFPDSIFIAGEPWKEELRRALDPSRPLRAGHH